MLTSRCGFFLSALEARLRVAGIEDPLCSALCDVTFHCFFENQRSLEHGISGILMEALSAKSDLVTQVQNELLSVGSREDRAASQRVALTLAYAVMRGSEHDE